MHDGQGPASWSLRLLLALALIVAGTAAGFFGVRALPPASANGLAGTAATQSASGAESPSPSPSPPGAPSTPTSGAPAPGVPTGTPLAGVGPVAADAPEPVAGVLTTLVDAAYDSKALTTRPGGVVLDALTGDVLYDHSSAVPLVPASTAKLATATAALTVLGADATIRTRVVADSAGRVVLVGGGDPTLAAGAAPAGFPAARLPDLARRTADALRARGRTTITIGYDASVFSGPVLAPGWKPEYVTEGDVAPVAGLMVDGGRVHANANLRSADPARAAAVRFAALLTGDGITVHGRPAAVSGSAGAEIASVQSPPLSALVDRMLALSDNDIAEALGRLVAAGTGRVASFAGAAAAVAAVLRAVGVTGVTLADASGLSRNDRVAPAALAALVRLAVLPAHPELRTLVTGLPIAGFSGTMADRFTAPGTRAYAGLVRAKTGTLNNVTSMAGTVVDRDGRELVFAFVSNRTKAVLGRKDARQGLDALIAVLAACGCR